MAGILHADSIVADSTISTSSPSRAVHEGLKDNDTTLDDVEPPLKAKRVTRTYGRSKARENVEGAIYGDSGSRARILKTAPRDADNQVIPESDDAIESGPKCPDFPWRARLKEIDDGFYSSRDGEVILQREATQSVITKDLDTSNTRQEFIQTNELCIVLGGPMEGTSLFDGPLSSLLSEPTSGSPRSPIKPDFLDCDNPATDSPKQDRLSSHKRVTDSSRTCDSDENSPQHPYPINSPDQRSSSTPPTSPLGEPALQDDVAYLEADAKHMKNRNSSKGKAVERRSKGLTKKEVVEMQKASARLLADQHVSIEPTHLRSIHTMAALFNTLKPTTSKPESDPIASFSSPRVTCQSSSRSSSDATIQSQGFSRVQDAWAGQIPDDGAEEEMPDPTALLYKQNEPAMVGKKALVLEEQKRKALEAAQHYSRKRGSSQGTPLGASDTDDDLEVEAMVSQEDENSERRGGEHAFQTTRCNSTAIASKSNHVSRKDLEKAAKPAFISNKGRPNRQRGRQASVSQKELNELLLQRAESQGGVIEDKKKEQWVRTGGVLKEHCRPATDGKLVIDWLHMGSTRNNAMEAEGREDGDDGDDPEYKLGDVEYPEGEESDAEASDVKEPDGKPFSHQSIDTLDEEDAGEDVDENADADADKENCRPFPRRHTYRAIVDSDDEDEMSNHVQLQSHEVFVPDTSLVDDSDDSSGGDKENREELAFSVSENKENEGIPRHPERGRVIDMIEPCNREALSTSPSPVFHGSKACREPLSRLDIETESALSPLVLSRRRDGGLDRVLQVIHEDATPAPISSMTKGGLHRRSSSTSSEPKNLDGSTLVSPVGFSQLFDETRVEGPAPGPVLGSGSFSQFFSQGSDDGDNSCATPLKGKMRSVQAKGDDFEFTQPNTLLPSIRISESQRREVDAMFGKDQEFKLDEAKASRKEDEHAPRSALNTQHFGSYVPSQNVQTPRSIRRPLETLSLEGRSDDTLPDGSPQRKPPRSTRLLRERPWEHSSASLNTPRNPRNAFDVLLGAAVETKQGERHVKEALAKASEYIEIEAQESDEEAMVGLGKAKAIDDNDMGDDDPNLVVDGLVDDTILDEKTQAKELVYQKHLEHEAQKDAELQKLHQDAVDGKLRGKRRDRGIVFDDSDSDEDDLSSSRKPGSKKRRVEGDNMDDYAKDPETHPFFDTYQKTLAEPDDTLDATLTEEHTWEDERSSEMVDPIKVTQEIIEKSNPRLRYPSPKLDPRNANWVDFEDQDMDDPDEVRVKNGPLHPRKVATSSNASLDHVEYREGIHSIKIGSSEDRQLKTWASQESRAHASATGRGGFSRKDSTSASGNISRKPNKIAPIRESARHDGKAIVKQSSLISYVGKRKGFNG